MFIFTYYRLKGYFLWILNISVDYTLPCIDLEYQCILQKTNAVQVLKYMITDEIIKWIRLLFVEPNLLIGCSLK